MRFCRSRSIASRRFQVRPVARQRLYAANPRSLAARTQEARLGLARGGNRPGGLRTLWSAAPSELAKGGTTPLACRLTPRRLAADEGIWLARINSRCPR